MGRADLHWHVLFDPAVVQERLVVPYREITHRAGVAPVEARWVHATVMHGGPVERYEAGRSARSPNGSARRPRTSSLSTWSSTVRRSAGSGWSAPPVPGRRTRRLWELTTRIDAEVTGARFPTIPSVYYPHLSLAYGVAGEERADRRAMKAAMPDLDPPGEPVVLRAERMSLVAQSHDRQFITWNHLADVPLHGGR